MKRSAFDEHRDQRIAAESQSDRHLMCAAHGCPLRWSVNFGEPLCSVHNGYERHDWPRVTEWLHEREADAAFKRQSQQPERAARQFTAADKRAVGQKLRQALRSSGGRQWAERLRDREQGGEHLTDAQRAMWRQALGRGLRNFDEVPE